MGATHIIYTHALNCSQPALRVYLSVQRRVFICYSFVLSCRVGFDLALGLLEALEFPSGVPWKADDVAPPVAPPKHLPSKCRKRKDVNCPSAAAPSQNSSLLLAADPGEKPAATTPPRSPKRRRVDSFPMEVATLALERLTQEERHSLLEQYRA
jgi:hypothetical protein